MKSDKNIWIGVDPGGKGNFGVAFLMGDEPPQILTVDCADEALAFIRANVDVMPSGIGVDAPLWWSSGRSGDRHADQWLRKRYKLPGGEVQAGNSLRGAALIQGAMFVQRIREIYPTVPVTESHPKALLKVAAQNSWDIFTAKFNINAMPPDEHSRDAIIAAVSAREAFEGRWVNDLSEKRFLSEQNPKAYWLAPVNYYWYET